MSTEREFSIRSTFAIIGDIRSSILRLRTSRCFRLVRRRYGVRAEEVDINGNVVKYASGAKQSKMRVSLIFPLVCGVALSVFAADRSPGDNERLTFLNRLLRSQGIDPEAPAETGMFIYNNLLRVIQ